CVCGKKIGPDPRNFNQRVSLGRNDLLIRTFPNKAQNFEVVAQYQFDFGLRPSVAYLQSKGKDLEGYGDQDILKYVDVGATYYFNKNMSTYVDYKINLLDDNSFTRNAGISTDDVVALGLVYQF
ncbi:porin, partial [Klebsiella pneumoniae]|uniref:porin n=1 Tax=Klebsiella pneumoniae TaxID=573 RepID=UPI0021690801